VYNDCFFIVMVDSSRCEIDEVIENYFVKIIDNRKDDEFENNNDTTPVFRQQSLARVLCSPNPFSLAISTPYIQLYVFLSGVFRVLEAIFALVSIQAQGIQGRFFRFFPDDPPSLQNHSLIIKFLKSGCNISSSPNPSISSTNTSSEFSHPISWDGIWLAVESGIKLGTEFKFSIERSFDNSSWSIVGGDPWFITRWFGVVPSLKHSPVVIDLRPPWHWIAVSCVGPACFAFGNLMGIFYGIKGRGRMGAMALVSSYFLLASLEAIVACYSTWLCCSTSDSSLCELWDVDVSSTLLSWAYFLCFGLLALNFFRERYLLDSFFILHSLVLAICLAETRVGAVGGYGMVFRCLWCGLMFASGLGFLVARSLLSSATHRLVAEDCGRYQAAWAAALSDEHAPAALAELACLAHGMAAGLDPGERRQFYPQTAPGGMAEGPSPPGRAAVARLDQLLVQASCLRHLLLRKVR
jgi:hypothetical protein